MRKLLVCLGLSCTVAAFAKTGKDHSISWRYQNAATGEFKSSEKVLPRAQYSAESPEFGYSDVNIKKTLFTKDLGLAIKTHIDKYQDCIAVSYPEDDFPVMKGSMDAREIAVDLCYPEPIYYADGSSVGSQKSFYKCPWVKDRCAEHKRKVSASLQGRLDGLKKEFYQLPAHLQDDQLAETLDLGYKLAQNMKEHYTYYPYYPYDPVNFDYGQSLGGVAGGPPRMSAAMGSVATKGLSVTGGGAQDFNFVKKTILAGDVPEKDSLLMEGFMGAFDLSLQVQPCSELICIQPAVASDLKNSKYYVQIAMNSAVTAESFVRPSLNLSLVIDISGSMGADDGTEKNRLEWAKEAALHAVDEMTEDDILSVVIFDSVSEILQNPVRITANNRADVVRKIKSLTVRGSTNLEAGLRDGYMLASKNILAGYQNRVILISDAGLNTGVTDDASLLKLVTDFAGENIGLTAIGLGLNFNQDFIRHISQSRGGNYIFVQSGKEMFKFFKSFDFLVTPIAYSFKANIDLAMPAALANIYGIPMPKEKMASRYELIDIQTLFFAGEGGGAILLEYDMYYE